MLGIVKVARVIRALRMFTNVNHPEVQSGGWKSKPHREVDNSSVFRNDDMRTNLTKPDARKVTHAEAKHD